MTRLLRRLRRDDDGLTLIDLVVGMTLMAIFMTMFTTAVVMMTRTASKVGSITGSSAQISQAFLKLDRMVRYSSAISLPPGASSPSDRVELLTRDASGNPQCVVLSVDTTKQQLLQQTWTPGGQPGAAVPMASFVTSASPFTLQTPTGSRFPQLQVALASRPTSTQPTTTHSTMTFTAVNSSADSSTQACAQGGW